MTWVLLLWLAQAPPANLEQTLAAIAASGRCATLAEPADRRSRPSELIAPGPPPLLSFRYYLGQAHQRFGNLELTLDDAGH